MSNYDLLIKNALVFDGSGNYPVYRDVAVAEGRVAALGNALEDGEAREVVDATGQWLLPGMFDIHTHLDLEVEVNPGLGETVRHGTTSVVVGNCSLGTAFGPQRIGDADPVVDCFARVESMPKSVLAKCVEKMTWDNTADYLAHFAALPLGPNIVPMIPHSMLRVEAMGLQAAATRAATPAELDKMKSLLRDAMGQGYTGFSLDSLAFHYLANTPNKEQRIPTQVANRDEIFPLVEIVRDYDRVMQTTPDNDNSWNTLVRLFWSCGRLYGKPLKVSALVAMDFNPVPGAYKALLKIAGLINSKFMQGRFHFQALPTRFRLWANGPESPIFEELPSTRELLACEIEDREGRQRLLHDPRWVAQFRADMQRATPKTSLWEKIKQGRPLTFRLVAHEMKIESVPHGLWAGETMADVLARLQRYVQSGGVDGASSPAEAAVFARVPAGGDNLIELFLFCLREYDLEFRWWLDLANCRPEIVEEILFHEHTLPGFNDSGAHITNMAFYDGNLVTLGIAQAHSLQKVATAVKRLTRDPAEFWGVDAGQLAVGARADLVLINPAELARYDTDHNRHLVHVPHYAADCMVNRSDGVVDQVYINGVRVWEQGRQYTDALGSATLGEVLTCKPIAA